MPELPEVETIANGINERVRGRTIHHVTLGTKPEPLKSPAALIEEMLTGAKIERVHRVGKTIVFDLKRKNHNAQFTVHLGMTGRLLVSRAEVEVPPHTHGIFALDDGREIRFVDARRFGRMAVVAPNTKYEGPGKEPLTISVDDFIALFKGRKTAIKAALLNQSLLHGVGNIYADESLFHAGIRPTRQAGRLTRAEFAKLHAALKDVIKHAIQLGGSSISDYVDADGVRGFFQLEHRVYGRTGENCKACSTPLKKTVVGGRTTHYCPKCQK
ncbi:MAG: bifunctional DNA-formamidopyrimidine glycosylase/DNA-(apurinic or apyrimidinic site) lyase [Acidobacteria bacterium]|nr:bifunctional DNA-formamidopyrimidine glycosylase/DNA-(apurinic or apyrimidinic site) lyase [Acidobacteriota bacterium]